MLLSLANFDYRCSIDARLLCLIVFSTFLFILGVSFTDSLCNTGGNICLSLDYILLNEASRLGNCFKSDSFEG
jgi:hypothetical protein